MRLEGIEGRRGKVFWILENFIGVLGLNRNGFGLGLGMGLGLGLGLGSIVGYFEEFGIRVLMIY